MGQGGGFMDWLMNLLTSGNTPYSGGGGGGGGLMNSLMSGLTGLGGLQEMNLLRQPWNMQMDMARTAMNPGAMNARIGQFIRPIAPQLVSAIQRATMPNINMAGMGTSPGMSQQILAEALAPAAQQQQNLGYSAAMNSMQFPFNIGSGAAGGYPGSFTELPYMMQLMNQMGQFGGGGGGGGEFPGLGGQQGYGGPGLGTDIAGMMGGFNWLKDMSWG